MRNCSTCGYFIPEHLPGQEDCMHPSPSGCLGPNYHKWIGFKVPQYVIDYIHKKQFEVEALRYKAERTQELLESTEAQLKRTQIDRDIIQEDLEVAKELLKGGE